MADALDELITITIGGTVNQNIALGFHALSVYIENYTNQYVSVPDVQAFIPPYTARLLALNGTPVARIFFGAPPGAVQVASITGQICNSTWSQKAFPVTGGPIGPIGVTSNYYDRNPLTLVFQFLQPNTAPHATAVHWTYTVPANRKAFLEQLQVITQLEAAGDLAPGANSGFAESFIFITPVGSTGKTTLNAYVQDVAPSRSRADAAVGASMELQSGDKIEAITKNTYTATQTFHYLSAKITEFDA